MGDVWGCSHDDIYCPWRFASTVRGTLCYSNHTDQIDSCSKRLLAAYINDLSENSPKYRDEWENSRLWFCGLQSGSMMKRAWPKARRTIASQRRGYWSPHRSRSLRYLSQEKDNEPIIEQNLDISLAGISYEPVIAQPFWIIESFWDVSI